MTEQIKEPAFAVGSVVMLKSGGDPMTVERVVTERRYTRHDGKELTRGELMSLGGEEPDPAIYQRHDDFKGGYDLVWFTQDDQLRRERNVKEDLLQTSEPRPAA